METSYVWSPERNDASQNVLHAGKATFLFRCLESTVVTFKVEGSAPHGNADSFYIAVDGSDTWDGASPENSEGTTTGKVIIRLGI